MKTIINKIVSFILALGLIIGAFEIYNKYIEPKAQTEFKVTNVLYESTNDFYLEPNEIALILKNNDYIIINTETNRGYYNNENDIDISTLSINNYGINIE